MQHLPPAIQPAASADLALPLFGYAHRDQFLPPGADSVVVIDQYDARLAATRLQLRDEFRIDALRTASCGSLDRPERIPRGSHVKTTPSTSVVLA